MQHITTYSGLSLKECWSNSAISKKDCNFKMLFWKLSGACLCLIFALLETTTTIFLGQECNVWVKSLFSYFEQVTWIHESLNYSKKKFFLEVPLFYLFDFMLWACVILAYSNFWFITLWQFQRNLHRIMQMIILDNYQFTNGSPKYD